jgi:hypothetical protein
MIPQGAAVGDLPAIDIKGAVHQRLTGAAIFARTAPNRNHLPVERDEINVCKDKRQQA